MTTKMCYIMPTEKCDTTVHLCSALPTYESVQRKIEFATPK
jgi:hypothetical protein